jgi:carboxymethylenebutenolidase
MPEQTQPDIAAVFDEHVKHEFVDKDVNLTMATMAPDPYVNHVPTIAGGVGHDSVREFYSRHFIGQWPPDTKLDVVSRTIGTEQVVDELVMSFTHTTVIDIFMPGIAPTGRRIEVPLVVVVGFRDGKVDHEHIYWDQATVLVQAGLLDPVGLPVTGSEQAAKMRNPRQA